MSGRAVAIAGVGYSEISRDDGPRIERLAVEACKNAVDDAGVDAGDIDGSFDYAFGCDSPDCHHTQRALGIADLAADAKETSANPVQPTM